MCESNAYIVNADGEKMIMENVTYMKVEKGKIFLTDLMGDEKIIDGNIQEIRLLDHKILIKENP